MALKKEKKATVFTIGHSNRSIEDFLIILKAHGVKHLIDVRSIPKSQHNPQFNTEELEKVLKKEKFKYTHLKGLGGLRYPKKDSINTAWENPAFRGYADYMQTDKFEKNLERLIRYAKRSQVAIMCAEAVPWRCHRGLIGDALLAKKISAEDIFSKTLRKKHKRTPWSRFYRQKVTYPKSALKKVSLKSRKRPQP